MYQMKCEHELKHNKETDIVFCVKCGERWEKGKIEYIPQYTPTYTSPTAPSYTCPYCGLYNCGGHT